MTENPYKSPESAIKESIESKPSNWHPLTWAFVGFGLGTVLPAPFILSLDPFIRFEGGATSGGIIGALLGPLRNQIQPNSRHP